MSTKTIKRGLLWSLVIFSLGSLVFTPFDSLWSRVISSLPWLGTGVIVSEAFFIGGLIIMAMSMGLKIRNPLRLRKELKSILRASVATKPFWVGFWVNALGAVASGILLGVGICVVLPVTSWGLLYLPLVDLTATVVIRRWALEVHARECD